MAKKDSRLVSLDIFRGMTVAFMIIVNTPGSWDYVYSPLRHAKWNGCTPTDLVFPFFLFIVGVSTWFSLKKYEHHINWASVFRILRRTVTIFALGLVLTIFPYFGRDYSTLRIMGVLQRIALAYGIGALICLLVSRKYLWIVVAIILLLYWALLAFFGDTDSYGLAGNLVRKVDIAILGKNHMYKGFGVPFDPEGILSTLPSVCTVLIGFFVGEIIGKGSADNKTFFKLFLLGAASTGLGLLWNVFFPINKPIWSSSYVLYTAGLAMGFLALIYLFADIWKFQRWGTFFLVLGMNALFSYFLSGIWARLMFIIKINSGDTTLSLYKWIYERIFVPVAGNMNGSLLFAISQMLLIWGLSYILYRKKIMIRL